MECVRCLICWAARMRARDLTRRWLPYSMASMAAHTLFWWGEQRRRVAGTLIRAYENAQNAYVITVCTGAFPTLFRRPSRPENAGACTPTVPDCCAHLCCALSTRKTTSRTHRSGLCVCVQTNSPAASHNARNHDAKRSAHHDHGDDVTTHRNLPHRRGVVRGKMRRRRNQIKTTPSQTTLARRRTSCGACNNKLAGAGKFRPTIRPPLEGYPAHAHTTPTGDG